MYYFFQKRPTRLLAALLAVCLTATLFSGCQLTKKPEDTSAPTEDSLPGNLVEVKPTEDTTPTTEATEPENLNMATVKKQANVRSSPSSGAKIIGYLDPGTQVEVIKTQVYLGVEWALIREGWIAGHAEFDFTYRRVSWFAGSDAGFCGESLNHSARQPKRFTE